MILGIADGLDTDALLDAARVGLAGLDVAPSVQENSIGSIRTWLSDPQFSSYRAQLVALIQGARWTTLLDSFYRTLPFGTGGRRGRVGIGPNRFNPWTLGTSVQGHAAWLRARHGEVPLSVVIGYDVRVFSDLDGALIPEARSPVSGVSSREFAELAAEIYAANEITVYLPPAATFMSTPELSHAVRAIGTDAGLVISASHNPPDDNGSKFYHAHGGQFVPPYDEEMAEQVGSVQGVDRLSLDRAAAIGLVREIAPEVRDRYLHVNLSCSRSPSARDAHIVFTPLHGTGRATVAWVLSAAGFQVDLEPSQAAYDGAFPGVPFRAPNPERPATLDAARATAETLGADLVMGTDPDADRLGVAVRHLGPGPGVVDGWRTLNGNEIAALVVLQALKNRSDDPVIFKTEVTSRLVERVAEAAGARVVSDLLVGFKYIGEAMHQLEQTGRYGALEAPLEAFCAGVEESHGALVCSDIRDKDAAGAALLLAELCAEEKAKSRTLVDVLSSLWTELGYVHNLLQSTVMLGAKGKARIDQIMANMRRSPPDSIGGVPVTAFFDRQDPDGPLGLMGSGTEAASRNVLVWHLGADARVILRPSGTEPKAKVYVELTSPPGPQLDPLILQTEAQCQALADDFVLQILQTVDISLPRWALRIDNLVSIEDKLRFVDQVMPQALERVANEGASEEDQAWLSEALSTHGAQAQLLYTDAVTAYVGINRPHNGEALLALFGR
jgi:phosphoglucomutase